jgi:hypothetical protein
MIVQEFMPALRLLKYINYHYDDLYQPYLVIAIVFLQIIICFIYEFINIQILFSRSNVLFTIGSYITVDLIKGFNKYHFNAIESDC